MIRNERALELPTLSDTSNDPGDTQSQLSSSTTQSCPSNTSKLGYKLTVSEKEGIMKTYINLDCKWQVSSGRYVENVMKEFTAQLNYERPACSLILDIDDAHWTDSLSPEELQEIKTLVQTAKKTSFPDKMKSFLEEIPKAASIKDVSIYLNNISVDPYECRELYWLKMSLLQAADLFVTGYLPVTDQQERDMIRRVWAFIDTAYDVSELTMRSERTSYASQLGNNKKRKLAAVKMVSRQATGDIPDMLIFCIRYEFVAGELSRVETDNAKEKNDASLKLLKIMKSMLLNLVQSVPRGRHTLKIVGMFLSGMKASFFELNNPTGQVCVVRKTNELYFPVHSMEFMKKMSPLVQQVWISKLEMESRKGCKNAEPLSSF